jgi:WD40 repeat protein
VHQRTISGYPKEVTSVSFVGVGSQALATSGDSTIRLHDTDDGKEIRKFEGGGDFVYTAVANGAGDLMITGGRDSVLRVWNLKSGELQGSFLPPGPVQK